MGFIRAVSKGTQFPFFGLGFCKSFYSSFGGLVVQLSLLALAAKLPLRCVFSIGLLKTVERLFGG